MNNGILQECRVNRDACISGGDVTNQLIFSVFSCVPNTPQVDIRMANQISKVDSKHVFDVQVSIGYILFCCLDGLRVREIFIIEHLVYVRDDLFHVSRSSVNKNSRLAALKKIVQSINQRSYTYGPFPPSQDPLFCRCTKRMGLSQFCRCYHRYLL